MHMTNSTSVAFSNWRNICPMPPALRLRIARGRSKLSTAIIRTLIGWVKVRVAWKSATAEGPDRMVRISGGIWL